MTNNQETRVHVNVHILPALCPTCLFATDLLIHLNSAAKYEENYVQLKNKTINVHKCQLISFKNASPQS